MVRDQRGMVLVMVLMILLVLVTLGTAISTFSVTDNRVVSSRQNSLRQYYAARGGAEAAAAYIINNTDSFRAGKPLSDYIIAGETPSLAPSRCLTAYNSYLDQQIIDPLSSEQTGTVGSSEVRVKVTADIPEGSYNNALITIQAVCGQQMVAVDLTPKAVGGTDPRNKYTWETGYIYWH